MICRSLATLKQDCNEDSFCTIGLKIRGVPRLVIFFYIKQGCWFYKIFSTLSSLILLHFQE